MSDKKRKEFVIPHEAIPERMTRVTEAPDHQGGGEVVERTEAMFTTYWASAAEQSPFFLAVMREKKLIGARCPKCGMVVATIMTTRCNNGCQNDDFSMVDMEIGVELPQVGTLLVRPAITVFASARFTRYAPFGRSYVMLGEATSALPVQVFTTTGFIKPELFEAGMKMKIIFRDDRPGFSTDFFAIPLSEVPEELRDADGVTSSQLDWTSLSLREPEVKDEYAESLPQVLDAIRKLFEDIPKHPRMRRDLAGWKRHILVKTGGGSFTMVLSDQNIVIADPIDDEAADLVLVTDDPKVFLAWTQGRSLVNAIRADLMGISNIQDMETVFKLDRLHRSRRRDQEEGKALDV